MLKIGVVGCGGIGKTHIRSYKEIPDVQVTHVYDLDLERAQIAADLCGAKAITDMKDFPDDLDAVSVVTPPFTHYKIVKQLLERGFNVFCEKPLTMDPAQGEELDALAKEKDKVLAVGFKMRYEAINIAAREYIPLVGNIVSITTTKLQAFSPRPDGAWVKDTGAMYELSVHDIDLITYITGLKPEKVLFSDLKYRFGWSKEDAFSIAAQYEGGVTALLEGMYAVSSTFCYRDFTMTVLGDKGYVRIERPDRIVVHTDEFKVVDVKPLEKNAFVLELQHFVDAVNGKTENTLTAEAGISATRLIEDARALSKK